MCKTFCGYCKVFGDRWKTKSGMIVSQRSKAVKHFNIGNCVKPLRKLVAVMHLPFFKPEDALQIIEEEAVDKIRHHGICSCIECAYQRSQTPYVGMRFIRHARNFNEQR